LNNNGKIDGGAAMRQLLPSAWSLVPTDFALTWLVQSTLLLGAGLLAGKLLKTRGPAVLSIVYRTTLVAALLCPFASVALAGMGFPGFAIRLHDRREGGSAEVGTLGSSSGAVPADRDHMDRAVFRSGSDSTPRDPLPHQVRQLRPQTRDSDSWDANGRASLPALTEPATQIVSEFTWLLSVAVGVWLAGSIILGLRLCVGHRHMVRVRSSAVPAESAAQGLCADLAQRMRLQTPALLRSPFLSSPCLIGLHRPAILLTEDGEDDLRETLIHELAHLLRRDGVWNLLSHSAVSALWVQPMMWLLRRRIEETAEQVCDDYVVQCGADRTRYAGLLLELAAHSLPPLNASAVAMISHRSLLARRVTRILDSARALSTRAGTKAVCTILAAGLAGTILAGLLVVANGGREALAQAAPKGVEAPPAESDHTIRGQVVGPDGRPFPGATVIAARRRTDPDGIGDIQRWEPHREVVRTTAGTDGRFEIRFDRSADDLDLSKTGLDTQVVATASGYGLGYQLKGQPIQLTAGDLPINGRLVDLEGRPVAGATVRLERIFLPPPKVVLPAGTETKSRSAAGTPPAATKTRGALSNPSMSKAVALPGRLVVDAAPLLPDGVVTGADGRFQVAGLGRDVLANLTLSGPTIAFKIVKVLTRSMDRVPDEPRGADLVGLDEPATHGANCTIVVEPTRPIEGVVCDTETHEPIPGVIVTAAVLSGSRLAIDGAIAIRTDARGRYRLVGLPKEGREGHTLAVYPPFDQPYFVTRRIPAPASPGLDPLTFDIALRRGIWISGKVTDVLTGKPVAAAVDYFPLLSNRHAKDYPSFDPNIISSIAIKKRYRTDRDGRYRMPGLPGGGVITAHTDDRSYRTGVGAESIKGRTPPDQLLTYDHIFPSLYQGLKEVNVPEGVDSVACDLGLDAGGSVRLRLVDAAGAPVTNTAIWGRFPDGADHGDHNLYGESDARIGGLVPGQPRTVLIKHLGRKIGTIFTLGPDRPENDAEITVTLRPAATLLGQFRGADGKPASGAVRVELIPGGASLFKQIPVEGVELDAEGRFRCEGVPPGGPYRVSVGSQLYRAIRPQMKPDVFEPFVLAEDLKLEPGQVVDFGTIDVNTGKPVRDG
jgi:beta-lactamase regulating signal transducer with metallopeptidase domain